MSESWVQWFPWKHDLSERSWGLNLGSGVKLSDFSGSSDPRFKMVTYIHYLNIRDTKHRMTTERFPAQNEDRERVVFSNSSTAYSDPLILPKWSNQISASSVYVPLKKNKNKTQPLSLKLIGLLCVDLTCLPFFVFLGFSGLHTVFQTWC